MDHTADLGAFFYGADLKEIFANAGEALFALMIDKPPRRGGEEMAVSVQGTDLEDLLVRWLSELLFLFQTQARVVTRARVKKITEKSLSATVKFVPFDPDRHGVRDEIKAATYHQIEIKPTPTGWRAKVIFDL